MSLYDLERRLRSAGRLPYGVARTAICRELLAEVEAGGEDTISLLPQALSTLTSSFCYGGEPEKMFLTIVQALQLYDNRPEVFGPENLSTTMWQCKWLSVNLASYPQVSRRQIDDALADVEQRYNIYGQGGEALAMLKFQWARDCHDPAAAELYKVWQGLPRDDLSDCRTCVAATRAHYLFDLGQLDEGIAVVQNSLQLNACLEEPGSVVSRLMSVYLDRGRPGDEELAVNSYRIALEHLARREVMTYAHGWTIEFLARVRQVDAALRHLHRSARFFPAADSPGASLGFLTHAGAGLRLLTEELGAGAQPVIIANLPQITTVAELWQWTRTEALRLAGLFDERDSNTGYTNGLEAAWRVTALDHVVPLAAPISAVAAALQLSAPAQPPEPAISTPDQRPDQATNDTSQEPVTSDSAGSPPWRDPEAKNQSRQERMETLTPAEYWEQAEQLVHRDPPAAAAIYLKAAQGFEAQGQLGEAALAHAEAARLAGLFDQLDEAERHYARAVDLFAALSADPVLVARVVAARQELLTDIGQGDQGLAALKAAWVRLDEAALAVTEEDLSDDLRARRSQEITAARALLGYTEACYLASLTKTAEKIRAAQLAEDAARWAAEADDLEQAAQAFQLAGGLRRDFGDPDEAIYDFESAFEACTMQYGHQAREQAAKVADELLVLLEAAGRAEDRAKIIAWLNQ